MLIPPSSLYSSCCSLTNRLVYASFTHPPVTPSSHSLYSDDGWATLCTAHTKCHGCRGPRCESALRGRTLGWLQGECFRIRVCQGVCVCVSGCIWVCCGVEACHKSCVQWSFKLATLSKINFVNCSHTHRHKSSWCMCVCVCLCVELTAIDKADVTSCGLDRLRVSIDRERERQRWIGTLSRSTWSVE